MMPDLPSPLLRSFVAIVDCGSMAAAATRVGRSESALSLQMTRLEGIVGQSLFDRDGRALRINLAGSLLLSHARQILARIDAARSELSRAAHPPIRIGVVQDFVADVLGPTLADLQRAQAGSPVSIVIGSSAELLQAMGEDRIDTALCAGESAGGFVAARFPMAWFGDAALVGADVLPLVGVSQPCPFLQAAQASLDRIGRSWRMALVTPSLDGVRAAVDAGIGLTCRTAAGLRMTPLAAAALPSLPAIAYSVIERGRGRKSQQSAAAAHLARHLSAMTPRDA